MFLWRFRMGNLLAVIFLMGSLLPFTGARAQSDFSALVTATTAVPLVTMTPRSNGCTVHIVGAGQTLWAIALAYGAKVADIQGLNGMGSENVTIYPGDTLVIRCMPQTPTLEPSQSVSPAVYKLKRTPTHTLPAHTRTPARVNTLPSTPTVGQAEETGAPGALVAGLLILTGGTLVVLLIFGLIRKR